MESNKPVVLVVDDEATNLRALDGILSGEFTVRLAPSGERALAFMERSVPDLILLDIDMPGMSGYDLIKILKKNPLWEDIPVLILTGQEDRDTEEAAFKLGAVDYIRKPISAGVVTARVRLHMELQNHRKDLEGLVEVRTDQLRKTQETILSILAG